MDTTALRLLRALRERTAVWLLVALCTIASVTGAAEPADEADPETPWPYELKDGTTTLTVYQPQLDSWDGHELNGRAAVSVREGGNDSTTTFGVIYVTARTLVDKAGRIVTFDRYEIARAEFPSAGSRSAGWVKLIEDDAKDRTRTIALDRLEANLHIVQTQQAASTTRYQRPEPTQARHLDRDRYSRSVGGRRR